MDTDDAIDNFDQAQANKEGWGIFDCAGSENGPWQLQSIDSQDDPEAIKLLTDDEAWGVVVGKAKEGSAYHQEALDLLAQVNPLERESIQKATGY